MHHRLSVLSMRVPRLSQFTTLYDLPVKHAIAKHSRRRLSCSTPKQQQHARPLTGYWAELLGDSKGEPLDKPLEEIQPATRTAPESPPAESLPKTDKEERMEKARIVFGSRLAGPGQREEEILRASTNVAGIMVPPKPTEPDNCCMSGCVNCVWDLYRDEMEEWATKSAQAREKLQAQRASGEATGAMQEQPGMPSHVATSMDDDGGGSESNWSSGLAMSGKEGDLFGDIPVGIREFMRTEKMLKDKHVQDKSVGA